MLFVLALVIFVVIAALVWAGALSLYRVWPGGPDPQANPHFFAFSATAVVLVGIFSFADFPINYFLSLGVWWFTAHNLFELPLRHAAALFLVVAALSLLTWLAVLGLVAR